MNLKKSLYPSALLHKAPRRGVRPRNKNKNDVLLFVLGWFGGDLCGAGRLVGPLRAAGGCNLPGPTKREGEASHEVNVVHCCPFVVCFVYCFFVGVFLLFTVLLLCLLPVILVSCYCPKYYHRCLSSILTRSSLVSVMRYVLLLVVSVNLI